MSIEKKSLISNRVANKKAIVTKPEVSKVVSAKLLGKGPRLASVAPGRIANVAHVAPGRIVSLPKVAPKF